MKLSYEQLREKLRAMMPDSYIIEMYDDHVVCENNSGGTCKYFRHEYTVTDDDKVTVGEPVEVQREYVPVKMSAAIRLSGAEKQESDNYGYKWRVRVVEFGTDLNNTHWTKEPLVAALDKFEGAKVFLLSEAQHTAGHPFGKPAGEIIGWLSSATADDKGIVADLNILKTAQHLRDALVDSFERGNPDLLGLSLDLSGSAEKKKVNGQIVKCLKDVKGVTVDVVYEPAAGGKFIRMAAAVQAGQKEAEMLEKLLAALKAQRPDLYASIEAKVNNKTITDDEVLQLVATSITKKEDQDGFIELLKAAVKDSGQAGVTVVNDAKQILHDARLIACGITLQSELKGSGLPDLSQKKLEKLYAGKVFNKEILQAAIVEEKEYLDKLFAGGSVDGVGDARITQTDHESRVKMLDDFFNKKVHSFKACYIHITGDVEVTGQLKAARRLTASIESLSWAEVLGDSITRKVVKEYNMPGLDDWKKIADIVPLSDFRTNHRTRMGGYGDLPIVAQGAPYPALASPGDEESTYAAAKRGGTEDVTYEAIKNDDAGSIRRVPIKLARSAKRTLHKFVFDFLATNPTIYDSVALFHANHGNLGSAALDATSLSARRQAMLKQTEAGSSERLGIPAKYLIVPVDLDKSGYDLITPPGAGAYTPTTPDYLKTQQIELIVVPYWTDTNNFYLAADKNDIAGIEIGFLNGKEEPEIFVQDLPNVGSMFSDDKLTYKIRHPYGGNVLDYRAFDGNVVA